jgi:hypothetical protein
MAEEDDIRQNIYTVNSRVEMKSYTGVSKDDTNSENDDNTQYTIARKTLINEEGINCNQSPNNNIGIIHRIIFLPINIII